MKHLRILSVVSLIVAAIPSIGRAVSYGSGEAVTWVETARLTASDGAAWAYFGWAVAASGDTFVVSSRPSGPGVDVGSAYVFERDEVGVWVETAKLLASDGAAGDDFGDSIALAGDVVVVGATDDDRGSAYVFERDGTGVWTETAKLKASDGSRRNFGSSVAVSGDSIAVAAGENDGVYVFERDGLGGWVETARFFGPDEEVGRVVAIDGDTLVAGARFATHEEAYVFERDEFGDWRRTDSLRAWDLDQGRFADALAVGGDSIVVGSPYTQDPGTDPGAAYSFKRGTGGDWVRREKLTPSGDGIGHSFGEVVAIGGDTLVVGDPSEVSAYLFQRDGTRGSRLRQADGRFGGAVGVSGSTVVVGAWAASDYGPQSGAAYVLELVNAPHIEVSGHCPGKISIDLSGATPDSTVGVLGSLTPGVTSLPSGPCVGTEVALDEAELLTHVVTNSIGAVSVTTAVGEGACGSFLQAVDTTGCGVGGVAVLPFLTIAQFFAADGAEGDKFGGSVSISGDTLVAGASRDDDSGPDTGSAYVFERDAGGPNVWGQAVKLLAADGEAGDYFGTAVAISGDTAVVGAERVDDGLGSVYVFERDAGGADVWGQVAQVIASDGAPGDYFGYRVALSGDTLVAGNLTEAVYVFERDAGGPGVWGQVAKLVAAGGQDGDWFGRSVAISGDTIVVGAKADDGLFDEMGSAHIFEKDAGGLGTWGQVAKLLPSDGGHRDYFGSEVGVGSDTVVVTSAQHDHGGLPGGSVYVFKRDAGGAGAWGEVTELLAADQLDLVFFASSVAISGDTIVVGSLYDDGSFWGVGAIHLFERDAFGPGAWGETATAQRPEGDEGGGFGGVVAISGETIVTGAQWGDQLGTDAGSAYVIQSIRASPLLAPLNRLPAE